MKTEKPSSAPREPSRPPDATGAVPGAQALVRGLDVLLAIGTAPAPLRFGELQRAVAVPKGSLHRLLAALQSRDLIRYDDHRRRYALGSRVFDLARRTIDQSSVTRAAKPELSRLARLLGRACCLYVQDGDEVFVLDFEDPDASQTRVVRVWPRASAHTSAAGLAIASKRAADPRATEDPAPVLGQAKALGYAIAGGDHPSVAAPVIDSGGYPVAAICCHFDTSGETVENLHEVGRLVREAAERASGNVNLGHMQAPVAPRPATVDPRARALNTGRDYVGENPVWDAKTQTLWWLDVLAPALRARRFDTGETRRILLPDLTGGLALTRSGKLLLAGRQGIHLFDTDSETATLLFDPEKHKPDNRFNSASLDGAGNLWIGTMPVDSTTGTGSFYRIGPDLSVAVMIDRIALPKNCAWSPDGQRMYLSEGASGRLNVYDLQPDGTLGKPRVFVQGTPETGNPNGIAMDEQGCVWVTMFGGWAVDRYAPDGTLMDRVTLPVPMPVALAFGGRGRDRLLVTSTYLRLPAGYSGIAPQSGNLIEIDAGVRGFPVPTFNL
jgi:sugar lactone lactonase YvrE/DNA-binding IclR family transcriptional regulator